MPLSVSQLIESAETGGEALRLIRAARDCTQAEIAEEAQLMLLALIDRAPERLKPVLRRARLGIKLLTFEAFLKDYPQDKITEGIATLDAVVEVWPKVKARWEHP